MISESPNELGVADLPVGGLHRGASHLRPENVLVEGDRVGGSVDVEERTDSRVVVGDGFDVGHPVPFFRG